MNGYSPDLQPLILARKKLAWHLRFLAGFGFVLCFLSAGLFFLFMKRLGGPFDSATGFFIMIILAIMFVCSLMAWKYGGKIRRTLILNGPGHSDDVVRSQRTMWVTFAVLTAISLVVKIFQYMTVSEETISPFLQ